MPSTPPPGAEPPRDGSLSDAALDSLRGTPFGVYVHVPFCTARCGYCDFNTYTDLGGMTSSYVETAAAELDLAARVLGRGGRELPGVSTVFVGGGTPTLLPAADLARFLKELDARLGIAAGAEVTTEANPETVDPAYLKDLRAAGFTRVSFGMQSVVPHVLATLDRLHTPERPAQCVRWARAAGFEHVSLDLIYGTPGESLADWRSSLDAAVAAGPDHVSAYALVVEPGTALAAKVARGEVAAPDDDDLADKYLLADDVLGAAGYEWYEVSNWARPGGECRHNIGYWRSANWWGIGPGAHSHVGGTRWWNVRHPRDYAARLASGESPAQARETLGDDTRRAERLLLEVRLRDGLDIEVLRGAADPRLVALANDGLVEAASLTSGRVVLTRRGRLLADAVVRALVD